MRGNTSKMKVVSALINSAKPSCLMMKFLCLVFVFIAIRQGIEDIIITINFACNPVG